NRNIAVAASRRDWTHAVGALNVQLVSDEVSAQQDQGDKLRADMLAIADAVSTAESEYTTRTAEAAAQQHIATTVAQSGDDQRRATIDAAFASNSTRVSNSFTSERAAVQGNYETAMYLAHKNVADAYYAQHTDPLSLYRKNVAAEDYLWALARAADRNSYYLA